MSLNLRSYTIQYALTMLALVGLGFVAERFDFQLPPGITIWLPAMVAAQNIAMKHGQTTGTPLEKGVAWKLAWPLTGCALAVQAAYLVVATTIYAVRGFDVWNFLLFVGGPALFVVLLITVGLLYLTNRFFLGLGVRAGIKAFERQGQSK